MTKKALAIRDAADHEEAVAGELGLIELATAPGASPDQLAWELQRRHLWRELLALAPVALMVQGLVPRGLAYDLGMIYSGLVWPVLLLYGTWQPVRASRGWSIRPLADLCFLGGAGLLAWATGATVGVAVGWTAYSSILGSFGLTPPMTAGVAIGLGLLAGIATSYRLVITSLVERELEALPPDQVPSAAALSDAEETVRAGAVIGGLARASFRAAGLTALAIMPALAITVMRPGANHPVIHVCATWALLLFLLALQYLARSLFYLGLTGEGLSQLRRRRRELSGERPSRRASRRAWSELRAPTALVRVVGLGSLAAWVVSAQALGAAGVGVGVATIASLVPLIPLGEPAEAAPSPMRRVFAGLLGALPAGLFLGAVGVLLVSNPAVKSVLGPATLLIAFVALERAAWLWARATRRLIHGDRHPPGPSPSGVAVVRRAALLGAALGFPVLALTSVLPWGYRELGLAMYALAAGCGPLVAVVAAMRLHLAAAEAPASGALPATTGILEETPA